MKTEGRIESSLLTDYCVIWETSYVSPWDMHREPDGELLLLPGWRTIRAEIYMWDLDNYVIKDYQRQVRKSKVIWVAGGKLLGRVNKAMRMYRLYHQQAIWNRSVRPPPHLFPPSPTQTHTHRRRQSDSQMHAHTHAGKRALARVEREGEGNGFEI